MASETEICNRALIKLGDKTIILIGEDSKRGRACGVLYAPTRDYVLRSHPWNFALKRVQLARNVADPVYDYAYSYKLPSDCLRVIIPNREHWEYGIEGRDLVTDYPDAWLKYIRRVTDVNQFDVTFTESLACKLAAELAVLLTDDNARHVDMVQLYDKSITLAKGVDAMEDGPKWITSEEWLDSRRSGVSGPTGIHRGQPK